jgi:hypothetical protein
VDPVTDPLPLDTYPHEDWCHWDMECCGCNCVSLWLQTEWGWA